MTAPLVSNDSSHIFNNPYQFITPAVMNPSSYAVAGLSASSNYTHRDNSSYNDAHQQSYNPIISRPPNSNGASAAAKLKSPIPRRSTFTLPYKNLTTPVNAAAPTVSSSIPIATDDSIPKRPPRIPRRVNGKLQPVQVEVEEVETVRRPSHPSLPKEHQHNCDSSSKDSSYSSNSESSEEDDDDDDDDEEENVFAWMGRTKKAKNRKVDVNSKGKQLATDPPFRSGNDDGSMKRINRSGVITPISTVQKNKRDRKSSATILSSSTTITLKMKGKAKRARKYKDGYDDDDDDDDDDYGAVDNGSMKKRKAKRARRYNDDYDDDDEEEEKVLSGSIHTVWTPELVRRCILCSNCKLIISSLIDIYFV